MNGYGTEIVCIHSEDGTEIVGVRSDPVSEDEMEISNIWHVSVSEERIEIVLCGID